MWLRHFRHKKRTKRFQAFRRRYYEYRPEDCVDVCRKHHTEVHAFYMQIISQSALKHGKCKTWSWEDAEALMNELRAVCAEWLKYESPGMEKLPPFAEEQGVSL